MSGMKIMFAALFLIAFSQIAHAGEFSREAIYIVDGDTFDIQTTAATHSHPILRDRQSRTAACRIPRGERRIGMPAKSSR
jgi:hypothetical protein